jgi:hypothetical protein
MKKIKIDGIVFVLNMLEIWRRQVWTTIVITTPQDLHENVNTGSYVGL